VDWNVVQGSTKMLIQEHVLHEITFTVKQLHNTDVSRLLTSTGEQQSYAGPLARPALYQL